jgi:hypothetical protein
VRYRNTLVLFFVSLAVASFYFFYLEPKIEEQKQIEDFEKTFFRADPREISFIRIETNEGPVDMVVSEGRWMISSPGIYQTDVNVIQKMLDALSEGRLIKVVGDKSELKKFGFDSPYIIVSLVFSDKPDILQIAGKSPSAKGYYAFNKRFGKIFLVNEEFVHAFNQRLFNLREKRLFLVDQGSLGRIRLKRGRDTIELVRSGEDWEMVSPVSDRVDEAAVIGLVDTLSLQMAEVFLDWEDELSMLPKNILIELFDREQRLIDSADVYYWGKELNRGTLLHRQGAVEAARTRREFFELLDMEASDLRYRRLFDVSLDDVVMIKMTWEGETSVIENNGGWKKDGLPVPDKKVLSIIETIREMKAVKLVKEDRRLGSTLFKLEVITSRGVSALDVSNFSMDHEISSASMFVPVNPGFPGREKVDYWYARSDNLDDGVIVSSLDLKKIVDQAGALNGE